jgi:MFS transporter, MHS family, shikimate and dehydroshikimate transport protein
VGTTIEWYDYFISGTAAALAWPSVFFPTQNPFTAVLASFVLYGVGFVGRPFGALIFGHFGDKIGRQRTLVWTLVSMGAGTLLIGLTPGFDSIGIAGGFIISFARILQGIGIGGEWGGASVWITETAAKSRRRGAWSSSVAFGVPLGLLASSSSFTLITSSLPHSAFLSYGWRIPFFIGAGVAIVGLVIRRRLVDTEIFKSLEEGRRIERLPSLEVLKKNFGLVVKLAAAWAYLNATFYITNVFAISYMTTGLHISTSFAASLGIYNSLSLVAWIGIGAYLADRVGRKRLLLISSIFAGLFPYIYFQMLNTTNPSIIISAQMLFAAGGLGYAPLSAFFAEQFPAKYRYSGASISYQLTSPLAGGLPPIIGAALVAAYGLSAGWILVSLMISAYSFIGTVATLKTRDTSKGVLSETGVERVDSGVKTV